VTLAEPAWDGQKNLTVASVVPLLGNDDGGYEPHRYELTVIADVPLQVPGAGTADDPTTCGPDGDDSDTAFNNTSAMTDPAGQVEDDQACAPIPSIDITKSVLGDPVAGKDGAWTITYEIKATNSGDADGTYTLTDRLRFGAGIDVTSAEVTSTPKGVTAAESWTGQGVEGDDANVVATAVNLRAGATHTYRVKVQATVDGDAANESTFTCPPSGSGKPGGFANTAGIGHNDLTDSADACATPKEPVKPAEPVDSADPVDPVDPGTPRDLPPLAATGATIGWITGGAALLILLGAAAMIISRHRRTLG
jgi:hypothetical protein